MIDVPAAFHREWRQLWDLAGRVTANGHLSRAMTFEPVGLILQDPDGPRVRGDYDSSPDGVMFATTGGDGVHFSAVSYGADALVVMTVPMNWDAPNVVLAEGLAEFLALGSTTGYFVLEQLAYEDDRSFFIGELEAGRPSPDPEGARLLDAVRDAFGVSPWSQVANQLNALAARHKA